MKPSSPMAIRDGGRIGDGCGGFGHPIPAGTAAIRSICAFENHTI